MKYLLLLLVIGVGLYILLGRTRKAVPPPDRPAPAPPAQPAAAAPMLACAHCGVHLPSDETVVDAAGRAYCGEAHRVAGPR